MPDRPKSGMLVPVEAWFKGPLLPYARERLLDGLTPYGFSAKTILKIYGTPALADGAVFLRTRAHLYCFRGDSPRTR
jgi:hypothetical protein